MGFKERMETILELLLSISRLAGHRRTEECGANKRIGAKLSNSFKSQEKHQVLDEFQLLKGLRPLYNKILVSYCAFFDINDFDLHVSFPMTESKKKPLPRRQHLNKNHRRHLVVILIVVLSSFAVWGISLFLGRLGPRKIDFQSLQSSDDSTNAVEFIDEMYQKMSAKELKRLSTGLEMEAQTLKYAGDYEAAALKYNRAFELQKNIDQNYSSSLQSDPSRTVRLKLEAKNAVAEPLFLKSLNLEQRADSLAETGDPDSARELLDQAIIAQQQLNDKYRDARQASALRLRQLKDKLAELKSQELYAEIKGVLERATSLKEIGEMKESGELFQEAALLQKQLNADFPDSHHASEARVNEFQKQKQIAQSALLAQEIQEKSALLEKLLALRKINEAEQLLVELKQTFQVFEESFPLSSLIDETLRTRLKYLHQQRTDLATIQDRVYDALLPVPDTKNVQMLRTDVHQSLYTLLMGANPSRNQAGSNPVDSVSWAEAKTFCERLSWILGRAVRLPTETEFRKAIGDFEPSSGASAFIWSALKTNGLSQPVGQKNPFPGGYFDLLGNVSEWLESEESKKSDTAFHIGGHVQDSLETIISVPVRNLHKTERSRLTGFRIVVSD